MKLYSMTATFGKLEHDTLTLKPGLNVIHAPNEWGKSTWCAFLLAMLYGLDTRAKSTRGIPDKEHFAPWSGSPMSGRIELEWDGRDITIERSTTGRIPLGSFRAYETQSGLEVPELTAANCGQMLLGVESSVFRRAGFIRLSDLPVTQDDSLRRRLNALVTTGDESGDGARLEKGLHDLKNRIRYNKSGLLPQAEQACAALRSSLKELEALKNQYSSLESSLEEAKSNQKLLENHMDALAYEQAEQNAVRAEVAAQAMEDAEQRLEALEDQCAALPSREAAEAMLRKLSQHRMDLLEFQSRQPPLPPRPPKVPRPFQDMDPDEAIEKAQQDAAAYQALHSPIWWILLAVGGLFLAAACAGLWIRQYLLAAVAAVIGIGLGVFGILRKRGQDKGQMILGRRYGSPNPSEWIQAAEAYDTALWSYRQAEQNYLNSLEAREEQQEFLRSQKASLCGTQTLDEAMDDWQQVVRLWDSLPAARRDAEQARLQYDALRAALQQAAPPEEPDPLRLTAEETRHQLQDSLSQQQRLNQLLGETKGRMERFAGEEAMLTQLAQTKAQIEKLEKTYAALDLAQRTLAQATAELQRRFAPRISKRAQALMAQMTQGRYSRLALGSDLNLQAGADNEDTLHDANWRSEGTIDQLYLALRLSVAEALTPSAPLILDDALVRFDETRLAAAMDILKDLGNEKQILLFTCQKREMEYLGSLRSQ